MLHYSQMFRFLLLPCFAIPSSLSAAEKETTTPNIVWIFTDDHAPNAIGAYNSRFQPLNPTPNIDKLAAEGMIFDRAYVGNSICAPSRATLLTGKHSHKNNKLTNLDEFNHDQQQFQKVLQSNGYQTALFGKIHLKGQMQGFHDWRVLPGQGQYENPVLIDAESERQIEGHSTDIITDISLKWLQEGRKKEEPFMLMVHYKAPHRNWIPAERFRARFNDVTFPEPENLFDDYSTRTTAANDQWLEIHGDMQLVRDLKVTLWEHRTKEFEAQFGKDPFGELEGAEASPQPVDRKALIRWKYQAYMRDYFGCIAGVDENIGRILAELKVQGLDKNTIVMYSSDQGFYLGEHGWFDKRFMYEESYRTPLVVRWPDKVPAGTRNSDLVQNIDFAETFLDLAGVEAPADMQGESLVPLMKGQTPADWRTSLYYQYHEFPGSHHVRRHEGVSTKTHKLIRFYGPGVPNNEEWELYDLVADPSEMKNIYDAKESVVIRKELTNELYRLREYYDVPAENVSKEPPFFGSRKQAPRIKSNTLLPGHKAKKKKK